MNTTELIKERVKELYESSPEITVSIKRSHPKLNVKNAPAVIKGVYANLFRVEEKSMGCSRCHSIQYSEVLIGQVRIAELEVKKENDQE